MATRIVEQKLEWCEAKIVEFLTQNGYTLATVGGKEREIRGRYARADRQGMLLRPEIEVSLSPLSNRKTRVYVGFQLRWLAGSVALLVWLSIGIVPLFVVMSLAKQAGSGTFNLHPLLSVLIWLPFCAWLAYCCVCRIVAPTYQMERHHDKMEQSLWEHLDHEDLYSHQIESPSRAWRTVFSFAKWAALLLMIVGGLDLIAQLLLPNIVSLPAVSFRNLWLRVFIRILCEPKSNYISPLFLLMSGVLFLVPAGWFTSCWALPHRYHWKVRWGSLYICWWTVVSLPCILLALYMTVPSLENASEPSALTERLVATQQSGFTGIVLFVQAVTLSSLLCLWPEDRDRANAKVFFAPPSTQYEWLSEQSVGKNIKSMFKRNRLWTWTVFLLFNVFCYAGCFYLLLCLIQSTAAMFGTEWALGYVRYWPLLVPAKAKIAAAEAFLLTCIIGAPVLYSVIQVICAHRRSWKALAFAKRSGSDATILGLPDQPLEFMRKKLRRDKILIIEVPDLSVNVRLDKKGLFKKYYLLWVSLGARKTLSESELEALLWHECAHIERVKSTIWRDIISFLSPWGPRFLDLTEDLYEDERTADLFSVGKMGSSEPLKSALQKIGKQAGKNDQIGKDQKKGIRGLRDRLDFLKVIWNLDWAGYLHPDINNRLHWLEDDGIKVRNNTLTTA